jgi:small-conductance mechanosensitive channel
MYQSISLRRFSIEDVDGKFDYRIQLLLTALLIGIAYYVGALLSFVLRVPSTRSSIIWIPNAILLAAFIVTPVKRWWLWTLAAVPAHILAQARDGAPILVLLCPFLANIAQAGLAAFSLRHLKHNRQKMVRLSGSISTCQLCWTPTASRSILSATLKILTVANRLNRGCGRAKNDCSLPSRPGEWGFGTGIPLLTYCNGRASISPSWA